MERSTAIPASASTVSTTCASARGSSSSRSTPCTLQVLAGRAEKRESFYLVPVELHSTGKDGQTILHARAEIVLATRLPEGIRSIIELPATPYVPRNGELYDRERLFHGPDLHGIEQVDGCSAKGIAALVKGAPPPSSWIRQPFRSIWLTDPLVIDSAFQLMILWSFERFGAGSLPCFAGRYRQFHESFPREGVQVVIRVTAEREHGATADMEFLDRHTRKADRPAGRLRVRHRSFPGAGFPAQPAASSRDVSSWEAA